MSGPLLQWPVCIYICICVCVYKALTQWTSSPAVHAGEHQNHEADEQSSRQNHEEPGGGHGSPEDRDTLSFCPLKTTYTFILRS